MDHDSLSPQFQFNLPTKFSRKFGEINANICTQTGAMIYAAKKDDMAEEEERVIGWRW